MTGWIVTRTISDGSRRYDCSWRVGGKIRSKTFRKRREADAFLTDTVRRVQTGVYVEVKPITFKEYAEAWLKGLGNLKPSTRRAYGTDLNNHLIPALGDLPLGQIGP